MSAGTDNRAYNHKKCILNGERYLTARSDALFLLESSSVLSFLWRFWISKTVSSGFAYVTDYDMILFYRPMYQPENPLSGRRL